MGLSQMEVAGFVSVLVCARPIDEKHIQVINSNIALQVFLRRCIPARDSSEKPEVCRICAWPDL
jgi:hypothetical protein